MLECIYGRSGGRKRRRFVDIERDVIVTELKKKSGAIKWKDYGTRPSRRRKRGRTYVMAISDRNRVRLSGNVWYENAGHVELSIASRLFMFDPRVVLGHHLNVGITKVG